jgi:hypothetical protein
MGSLDNRRTWIYVCTIVCAHFIHKTTVPISDPITFEASDGGAASRATPLRQAICADQAGQDVGTAGPRTLGAVPVGSQQLGTRAANLRGAALFVRGTPNFSRNRCASPAASSAITIVLELFTLTE